MKEWLIYKFNECFKLIKSWYQHMYHYRHSYFMSFLLTIYNNKWLFDRWECNSVNSSQRVTSYYEKENVRTISFKKINLTWKFRNGWFARNNLQRTVCQIIFVGIFLRQDQSFMKSSLRDEGNSFRLWIYVYYAVKIKISHFNQFFPKSQKNIYTFVIPVVNLHPMEKCCWKDLFASIEISNDVVRKERLFLNHYKYFINILSKYLAELQNVPHSSTAFWFWNFYIICTIVVCSSLSKITTAYVTLAHSEPFTDTDFADISLLLTSSRN